MTAGLESSGQNDGFGHIADLDPCENPLLHGPWQLTREYYIRLERASADVAFTRTLTGNQRRMLAAMARGEKVAGNGAARWLRKKLRAYWERKGDA